MIEMREQRRYTQRASPHSDLKHEEAERSSLNGPVVQDVGGPSRLEAPLITVPTAVSLRLPTNRGRKSKSNSLSRVS